MNDEQTLDFYQQLRSRIKDWERKEGADHTWAEYILLAPDLFHLLCKLALDKEVPSMEKAKLAAAIAYFVSPIDIIPEAILGPIGYVDDIALAAYVLNSIITASGEEIVTRHWAGEKDLLAVLKDILDVADRMV
ncbi:DUF1232 domain-containing protein, partial [bacterium]|nr:DUF1232 domain-containing protein [bacterium]